MDLVHLFEEDIKLKKYLLTMSRYILTGNNINLDLKYVYELFILALNKNILNDSETIVVAKSILFNQFVERTDDEIQLNASIKKTVKNIINTIENKAQNYARV